MLKGETYVMHINLLLAFLYFLLQAGLRFLMSVPRAFKRVISLDDCVQAVAPAHRLRLFHQRELLVTVLQ